MTETKRRRRAILQIARRQRVETQSRMNAILKEMGFSSTQATVSRDIANLKLIKVDGAYAEQAAPLVNGRLESKLAGKIRDVRQAGDNLVVIKTDPGDANSVALAIDSIYSDFIVGTVAGDDTVLAACDGLQNVKKAINTLTLKINI